MADEEDLLRGSWNIEFQDEAGALHRGWVRVGHGIHGFLDGERLRGSGPETDQGATLVSGCYHVRGNHCYRLEASEEGGTLVGSWEGDAASGPGQETGMEVWRRFEPKAEWVEVTGIENGGLDRAAMADSWKYAFCNGNLPRVRLEIHGRDLPRYPMPDDDERIFRCSDTTVSFDDPHLVQNTADCTARGDLLRLEFWLTEGIQPGTKVARINGLDVPFDLEFTGEPEEPHGSPWTDHAQNGTYAGGQVWTRQVTAPAERIAQAEHALLAQARRAAGDPTRRLPIPFEQRMAPVRGQLTRWIRAERGVRIFKSVGGALNLLGGAFAGWGEHRSGQGAVSSGLVGATTTAAGFNPYSAAANFVSTVVDVACEDLLGVQRPGVWELVNNAGRFGGSCVDAAFGDGGASMRTWIARMRRGELGSVPQAITRGSEAVGEFLHDLLARSGD
ncbi:MAG: hypothetical protein ABIO70_31980 [Pseudomonadota bacterium]